MFSLPALNRSAEAQKQADDARRLAVAMAILTQTRIAAVRYGLVADEFLIWDEASRDDDLIVQYLAASAQAGIDMELEIHSRQGARDVEPDESRSRLRQRAGEYRAAVQLGGL